MDLAVKFYGKDNHDGLPEMWPMETFEIKDPMEALPEGFIKMSDEEYKAHTDKHSADYDAWLEKKTRPIINKQKRKQLSPSLEEKVEALLEMVSKFAEHTPKLSECLNRISQVEQEYPID